ncbi:MAG: DUF389 domain-containing protein [Bacteroidetes bacterium]|jgi:uncharacterized hydrophobic protein (TIGR00271 family)|nr:DUF389 domain-containing protein [Bacteroidota bacterium]MDA0879515.1 DUF389 domain-containing protein [Bacteroidota bacterium]MDA1115498.1 DUF389 domain-containing protein [Bacteroidota bacterium]MDP4665082.1 DUF389 domain-containing protein [Flavobacteriaceae bacterium]
MAALEPIENQNDVQRETVKREAIGLWKSSITFISNLLDFRNDTDKDATIAAITSDIPFRGATAWILICSVFVASIGLNANSPAVVIGAMLISPLMGPILGIGLSVAMNDIDTLKKSLVNFAVMVVLSVLTAYLFFELFPLSQDSSELLARTKPDIRDVLIAFFGGLALIIAKTKKGTIASTIFGVAIATALMPPLCTVGFGLAKGGSLGWEYAAGALYLFTINTIFIGLATFLVLKVLRFPMQRYANSNRRKLVARLASILAIVVMIPAVYTFIQVYKKNVFETQAGAFIQNEIRVNKELQLLSVEVSFEENFIELNFFNEIGAATKADLISELRYNEAYKDLKEVDLKILGSDTSSYEIITKVYEDTRQALKGRELEIGELKAQIEELKGQIEQAKTMQVDESMDVLDMLKSTRSEFPAAKNVSINQIFSSSDLKTIDTSYIFRVEWKESEKSQDELNLLLKAFVESKYKLKNVSVTGANN